jgi:hypothetical protein
VVNKEQSEITTSAKSRTRSNLRAKQSVKC